MFLSSSAPTGGPHSVVKNFAFSLPPRFRFSANIPPMIYLDGNATMPISSEVREAMLCNFTEESRIQFKSEAAN
jgi:hypothetical protein